MTKEEISEIFHDIKQPLVSLSGYIQLMELEVEQNHPAFDYIEKISSSLERLNQSLNLGREKITNRCVHD